MFVPLVASKKLTGLERWLNSWWPSRRLREDPLANLLVDGRYAPVSIANWKLTPQMARRILARRVVRQLSFVSDRRLTVVIPYRDRETHLRRLLPVLVDKLREQQISHRILVVEQEPGDLFNRGRLINIGIHYDQQAADYYCIHDADAVPVVADYRCPSQPLRLVHTVLTAAGESLRPAHYFSGAICVRKEHLLAANGFSNGYWGWGKEDDDLFFRLLLTGCVCYVDLRGVFHDLPNPAHQQVRRDTAKQPPHLKRNRRLRSHLLRGQKDFVDDGLSTLHYRVIERTRESSYEKIRVRW